MNLDKDKLYSSDAVVNQTHRVIDEAKKLGNQVYEDGKHRLDLLQDDIHAQSDKLVRKVHDKPLASLLCAVGVGFILAHLLRR